MTLVIPARGGSKGIPKKNLIMLGGMSLLGRAVRTAVNSLVDRVIVSTDDEDIAEEARRYGAQVVKRPEEISTDTAMTEQAVEHALMEVNAPDDELVVLMQATSPLTEPQDINNIVGMMGGQYDSIFSGVFAHGGCLCGGFRWTVKDGVAFPDDFDDPARRPMRQQIKTKKFIENGALWAFTHKGITETLSRLYGVIGVYEMPRNRSFEIDEIEDLEEVRRLKLAEGLRTL